jgi:transcriptional repressor NrdR
MEAKKRMKCPFCAYKETQVIETRESAEDITRRRRECLKCKKRFTTYEKRENVHIRVIKRDGNRELFDREKLKKGLLRACEKRPVPIEKIDLIISEIESKLSSKGKQDIKSSEIGELVMQKLRKLDAVAYIRFASVYKKFQDVADFKDVLKELKTK